MAIVKTNINYTHSNMMNDIHEILISYPFIQKQTVGYSVLGKPIPVLRLRTWYKKSILFRKYSWK